VRLKRDSTRAETRFRLSPKRTSPFKSAGASVQLTAGSQGVRIGVSNAGYATFRGSVRVLATHSIHQFPLHFPTFASPYAIRFKTRSTYLGVLAVDLRSRCVVLCTVCRFVSDWNSHVRGWEGSKVSRISGFGSPGLCSEMSFPSLWRECI
jgi:hypothetical protein